MKLPTIWLKTEAFLQKRKRARDKMVAKPKRKRSHWDELIADRVRARCDLKPRHLTRARGFSFAILPATSIGPHNGDSYEKWKEETRLDIRTGARTEIDGAQESARGKDSQEVKADWRRDATKGVQYWIVARLARVIARSVL
jgi:hypothetical protein